MPFEEERDTNLPSETPPETGGDFEPLERPAEQLGDTADSVTRQLRDLQDELMAPTDPRTPAEPGLPDAPRVPSEAAEPAPVVEPSAWPVDASTTETHGPVDDSMPGAPVSSTTPSSSVASALSYRAWTSGTAPDPDASSDDKLLSMLAWLSLVILQLPVVSVIQLLSSETQHRSFQRHHAVTSLLFFAAGILYEVMAAIVFTLLTTVTLGCAGLCLWVLFFVPHALALYYAFQAYGGKRVELPYLSAFGRRQGWL